MPNRRPRFLNPNAAPPAPPAAFTLFFEGWRKTRTLAATFVAIILACSGLYFIGSQHGWGIESTFQALPVSNSKSDATKPDFLDCVHFSVETITTLGYGDYRPVSFGRTVAGAEVLGGIILMGMFVARLVSGQQDRLTRRLVTGQLNREIQDFRNDLADLLVALRAAATPVIEAKSDVLSRAAGLALSIARYWRHEAKEPDLADIVQVRAAGRLLGGLIALLQTVDSHLAGRTRENIHRNDRNCVRNIAESVLTVSTVLNEHLDDAGLKHSHERVVKLVKSLRVQFKLQQTW